MNPVTPIPLRAEVQPIISQLISAPELWNEYQERTASSESPHREVDDIWFRYCPRDHFQACHKAHISAWYPAVDAVPAVKELVHAVCGYVGAKRLGGVLMTRIPPGAYVYPHTDGGWHADFYEKICVSIAANKYQAFCFDGVSHVTEPGEMFWFENSLEHWVTNASDEYRISLIICLKRGV